MHHILLSTRHLWASRYLYFCEWWRNKYSTIAFIRSWPIYLVEVYYFTRGQVSIQNPKEDRAHPTQPCSCITSTTPSSHHHILPNFKDKPGTLSEARAALWKISYHAIKPLALPTHIQHNPSIPLLVPIFQSRSLVETFHSIKDQARILN